MGHQPQVVPDDLLPRTPVPRPQSRKGFDFLPRTERLWETPRFQMQRQHQKFCSEKLQQR